MNLNELLTFIKQIIEPEVAEQVLQIVQDGADTYVEPMCKVVAKSCATMHYELTRQGFSGDDATKIVVAMAGKGKGGQ